MARPFRGIFRIFSPAPFLGGETGRIVFLGEETRGEEEGWKLVDGEERRKKESWEREVGRFARGKLAPERAIYSTKPG